MSRFELYSPEGLRVDGRRWNELRKFSCGLNTHANSADGSSFVEIGETKVICIVQGPKEPEIRSRATESAYLNVNISVSPFSTIDRKKRPRNDRRVQEATISIQKTFQEAILGHLYPRTEIIISLHVLAEDGGFFPACINATTLALIDAGVPMYEYVSSCSTALHDSINPLLDPNNAEESDLSFLTTAIIGKSEKLSLILLESKIPLDRLESLIAVTISGCHSIRDQMDREVRKHGKSRVSKLTE